MMVWRLKVAVPKATIYKLHTAFLCGSNGYSDYGNRFTVGFPI
jgi:hypothetical protein